MSLENKISNLTIENSSIEKVNRTGSPVSEILLNNNLIEAVI